MKKIFKFQDFILSEKKEEKKPKVKVEIEETISPDQKKKSKGKESQGSDDVVIDMMDNELKK
jgi:hypothetical protein